jgi:hypothetical protein
VFPCDAGGRLDLRQTFVLTSADHDRVYSQGCYVEVDSPAPSHCRCEVVKHLCFIFPHDGEHNYQVFFFIASPLAPHPPSPPSLPLSLSLALSLFVCVTCLHLPLLPPSCLCLSSVSVSSGVCVNAHVCVAVLRTELVERRRRPRGL